MMPRPSISPVSVLPSLALAAAFLVSTLPADDRPLRPKALPLAFVENAGQWNTPARFLARRGALAAAFLEDKVLLRFNEKGHREGLALSLAFEGALPAEAV